MAQDLAYSYAALIKSEKQEDGTLKVYGKATDDSIDIDQQICDDDWLKRAMPDWFVTGGNVREQHSNIAAGVATDYEAKADGHYITALVVDPVSVKKVEAGVLKGFSIGIRGPRVVRDTKAAGGRIVDGQIIEISLVDRPANPNAKLMLAKAADGGVLEPVKQLTIPSPADIRKEQERDELGRFGSGGGGSSSGMSLRERAAATAEARREEKKESDKGSIPHYQAIRDGNSLEDIVGATRDVMELRGHLDEAADAVAVRDYATADTHLAQAAGIVERITGDSNIVDQSRADSLNRNLSENISRARDAYASADNYKQQAESFNKSADGDVVKSDDPTATLEESNEGATMPEETTETVATEEVVVEVVETATEEVAAEEVATEEPAVDEATEIVEAAKSLLTTLNKFDQATYERAVAAIADLIVIEAEEMKDGHDERNSIKELLNASKHLTRWYEGEVAEGEVLSAMPTEDDIYMAADTEMESETDKQVEVEVECECDGGEECECGDKMCKCNSAEKSATLNVTVDDDQMNVILNKAVASAKAAVIEEIDALKTALEAESAKSIQLEQDLAIAKKAAVAGGPARAAIQKAPNQNIDTLFAKAAEFRQKAASTQDKTLAEGYRELADDLEAKARTGN
jgi:hypothetical protein